MTGVILQIIIKKGDDVMYRFLYVSLGQIITYSFIVSFFSMILATPFLLKPNLWEVRIYNIKIIKYCIVLVAIVVTMTITNVTIK